METPKNILLASGKLAQASKSVIHSSAADLSYKLANLDEALQEYNALVFEALSSGSIKIEEVVELNIDHLQPNIIEYLKQCNILEFRPRRK